MNLGELKAFLGDRPRHIKPALDVQQQLREMGLRQAEKSISGQVSLSTNSFSSQTKVGLRVFHHALNQSLEVGSKKANLPAPEPQEKSLFDFEEVAKNVLSFVGGAIKLAAARGADEDALSGMFEQAREGVLKGVKLAEKDLAGVLNDEISQGIARSQELIEQGIAKLHDDIFAQPVAEQDTSLTALSHSESYSRSQSGELTIRTRDGDQVRIRFEDLQAFQQNQRLLLDQAYTQPVEEPPSDIDEVKAETTKQDESGESVRAEGVAPQASLPAGKAAQAQDDSSVDDAVETVSYQQSSVFYQNNSFAFSLQGELDEAELQAIGQLVADADELADSFFGGDIESAFQQALDLGYNERELAGFALQLTRKEQVQVVQTYEAVSHFNEEQNLADPVKATKPVSAYLDKMLNVFEQSKTLLESSKDYNLLVNEIINQSGQAGSAESADLLSAINRFHQFNARLLDNLPVS